MRIVGSVSSLVRTDPFLRDGPVEYSLGSQQWDPTSEQCSFGEWDEGSADEFF